MHPHVNSMHAHYSHRQLPVVANDGFCRCHPHFSYVQANLSVRINIVDLHISCHFSYPTTIASLIHTSESGLLQIRSVARSFSACSLQTYNFTHKQTSSSNTTRMQATRHTSKQRNLVLTLTREGLCPQLHGHYIEFEGVEPGFCALSIQCHTHFNISQWRNLLRGESLFMIGRYKYTIPSQTWVISL